MTDKLKILFLCTGNSCRSQMAEGFARALRPDIEACSAGIEPHGLNPLAVEVMAKFGIDISCQRSQHLDEFKGTDFDYVITLCGSAHENCPYFSGKIVHHGFDDPPELAKNAVGKEENLVHYRRVRDEIKAFIENLPAGLENDEKGENE